jgi:hypothetical protein
LTRVAVRLTQPCRTQKCVNLGDCFDGFMHWARQDGALETQKLADVHQSDPTFYRSASILRNMTLSEIDEPVSEVDGVPE